MQGLEGKPELANELALFNRVGDLYLKLQKTPEAVEMYERAANLYAEYGFPNNAIALCNKVLRNAPGRTHVYLRLAQLMVERGLIAQAKENLLEYAERMQSAGKTDDAFRALKEFADLSPDNEEIRLLLAEQLKGAARTAEAREQLAKLFAEAEATGDKRRSRQTLANIKAIDPEFDPTKAPKAKIKSKTQKTSDLVFLDLDEEYRTDAAGEALAEPEEEVAEPEVAAEEQVPAEDEAVLIEPTSMTEELAPPDGVGVIEGLELPAEFQADEGILPGLDIEHTSLVEEEEATGQGDDLALQEPLAEQAAEPAVGPGRGERASFEVPDLDLGEIEVEAAAEVAELELPSLEGEIEEAAEPVPAAAPAAPEPPAAVDIPTLEARIADDPDDPRLHVSLGEALLEQGQRERGLEELDIALGMFEAGEKWKDVARIMGEILRIEPNSVRHHQKRVEGAFRSGDKREMVQAYLGLGNALLRSGAGERSEMVFRRVLEYEPDNEEALTAIASLVPEEEAPPEAAPAAAAAPSGYVDLGALIFDDDTQRDTRMRVEDEEPTGDEEKDFADMLAQFKRGIEANIEDEDWQAHYDLGVAFKEMGLVDEAIAEFQKALRSPPGRLRTAEALGSCFFDKKQFSVAATVMKRAVDTDPSGDDAKIALLYWLGRCEEEMGHTAEALSWFQRVFALDIRFADVADRVERLAAAGH